MNNPKTITIFSQKLAGYLMMHSFVLIGMRPNNNNAGKNVFFFNNTPDLRMALEEYRTLRA